MARRLPMWIPMGARFCLVIQWDQRNVRTAAQCCKGRISGAGVNWAVSCIVADIQINASGHMNMGTIHTSTTRSISVVGRNRSNVDIWSISKDQIAIGAHRLGFSRVMLQIVGHKECVSWESDEDGCEMVWNPLTIAIDLLKNIAF